MLLIVMAFAPFVAVVLMPVGFERLFRRRPMSRPMVAGMLLSVIVVVVGFSSVGMTVLGWLAD
ncbi:hypothetical protein [Hamadaea tsunoensis]|uniref:hypothetical protein n=1 Tax=Hamadaea tsunoensis TaxID=53368 RepID=UPI0012F8FB3F|nr:hypothetical protein [Hamadaea tsunoensis]